MEKDELIGKLSNFIRKEKFQEINEIIKKFKDEKNYDMVCFSSQAFINMDEYKEALKILEPRNSSTRRVLVVGGSEIWTNIKKL